MILDSLDISVLREVNLNRMTALDGFFIFISKSGPIIVACIPLAFIIFGFIRKKKKIWLEGFTIAASYLFAGAILNIMKAIIQRPRPFTTFPSIIKLSSGGSSSFPSGHTSDAFTIAMILSLLYPKRSVVIPAFLWAIIVGYSRMDLGVHYPSDVIGGVIVGMGSAFLCYRLYKHLRNRYAQPVPEQKELISLSEE